MKNVITLCVIVLLSGCALNPFVPETKVVTVKQPIPYCPAPPTVPGCTNYVDELTVEDASDPGKVALAYKLDMTCYRANDATLRNIMKTYESASLLQADVDKLFNQLYNNNNKTISPPPKP